MTSVLFSTLVSMCRPQMDWQATKHHLHIQDLFLIYYKDYIGMIHTFLENINRQQKWCFNIYQLTLSMSICNKEEDWRAFSRCAERKDSQTIGLEHKRTGHLALLQASCMILTMMFIKPQECISKTW